GEREAGIPHDALGIEETSSAEAVAGGTGAGRIVEREQPRLELSQAVAASRAGEFCREHGRSGLRLVHEVDAGDTVTHGKRSLEGFCEAQSEIGADAEPVDDDFDIVLAFRLELG